MTWLLLSDDMFEDYDIRATGSQASFLFVLALAKCATVDGDGLLPVMMVKDAAGLYDLHWRKLAPKLVDAAMWHTSATVQACAPCMENGGDRCGGDAWFIHAWWKYLLDAKGKEDRVHRWRETRKRDLGRRPALKGMVRRRDHDACRYCGVATRWDGDRKSGVAGTLDHVDPWCTDGEGSYGNTAANLVVACRTCNGRKRDRTPEEAGMALLPEPAGYQGQIRGDQGTDQPSAADRGPDHLAPDLEAGRDRISPGFASDPSLDRPGSPSRRRRASLGGA